MKALIRRLTELSDQNASAAIMLREVPVALKPLLKDAAWLPDAVIAPHPDHYQQYLLYADPRQRFSVVSFVWGPGQETPVHDHCTWGVVGQLQGNEVSTNYARAADGALRVTGVHTLGPGEVIAFSPEQGDIHQVRNGSDKVSISIHIYGSDIGRTERHKYDPATGAVQSFISGYSPAPIPVWS
jgi:predicted metal-dependent enzyme (double-stranded beta helix superfamily)